MPEQNVRINFSANIKQLQTALKTASSKIDNFGKSVTKAGKNLSVKLSGPLALAGGMALKQAANFEKLQTTLNVLTGSAEEGAKAFERLVQFSAKTPFQLDELVRANNTMMGFGLSADDAYKSLQQLGDIAAVAGGDLNRIAVAFGQSAAEGRLMTRDILQFINNGVPMYELLADVTGRTAGEVRELASEGKITFDILQKALAKSTQEGGKFHGGMKILSTTLNGLFSTLKDNVNIALAQFGQEIAEAFNLSENIPKITKFISDLAQKFSELSPATKRFIVILGGIGVVLPPILIVLGTLISSIGSIIGVVKTATIGIKALNLAMGMNPAVRFATIILGAAAALKALGKARKEAQMEKLNEELSSLTLEEAQQKLDNLNKTFEANTKILEENNKKGLATKKLYLEDAEGNRILTRELEAKNKARGVEIQLLKDLIKEKQQLSSTPTETPTTSGTDTGTDNDVNTRVKAISVNALTASTALVKLGTTGDLVGNVLTQNFEKSKTKIQELSEVAKLAGEGIEQVFVGMGISLAESLGGAGTALSAFLGKFLSGAMQFVAASLAQSLGLGVTAAGQSALKAGPMAAFVLPALIAGATAAVTGAFKKIPKFANGGIVNTPTLGLFGEYPGAKSNPEVVTPLDKLKNMIGETGGSKVQVGGQFVLKGQDLVVALQRADRNRNRIK